MMTTTSLGDKPINRIGFGAMQLACPGVFGPPRDPAAARAVLCRAIELGVDHIDTAQYYGPNVVNDLIREALYPYPENLKLVTKVGARRDAAGQVLAAQRPDELRCGVEANLRSLRVERLDLVNLRLVETGDDTAIPLEAQLSAMDDMRREGKFDLIGLSNIDQATVQRAFELVDVAEIQNGYSIGHSIVVRRDDEMVDVAREHGIAFAPRGRSVQGCDWSCARGDTTREPPRGDVKPAALDISGGPPKSDILQGWSSVRRRGG